MTNIDHENTSYFEVSLPGHIIAYENIDNLFKMISIYPNLLYSLKLWCLKNAQNSSIIRGFDLKRQSTNFLITLRI